MKHLLCHEYLQRHSIKVPLVFHVIKTNVILWQKKEKNKPNWRVLSLNWRSQDYHPGFYEVNYIEAIHNGFVGKKCFNHINRSDIWSWDQYEINLLKIVKEMSDQKILAKNNTEQLLAAWEMFVFLTDSYLAKKFNYSFFHLLERSTHYSYSLKERKVAFQKAEIILNKDLFISSFWNNRIKPISYTTNNKWLIKLINQNII
jgi:hypothetical protein